jgi:carboxyl-terminal processing protease
MSNAVTKGFVAGTLVGFAVAAMILLAPGMAARNPVYDQLDRFADAFERISAHYVRPVDSSVTIDAAIQGMASSLDPHSSYMNEKDYQDAQTATNGSFGGVGLELTMINGVPAVVAPIEDMPAAIAGIKPGDLIETIDGQTAPGSLADTIGLLKGPIGSTLVLTIGRRGAPAPLRFALTRADVHINTVRSQRMGDFGYLRVVSIDSTTDASLKQAIVSLKSDGRELKGYILDLRNCPGGLLDTAVSVASEFLDGGKVLSTRGRTEADVKEYDAKPGGDLTGGKPLVVLINASTSAGAEFVAAALQDNHRAHIFGTRSYGNGTVQTIIPLGKGGEGALRLTTSTAFTPAGRPIQEAGVEPDVTVIQSPGARINDSSLVLFREVAIRGHLKGGQIAAPSSTIVKPDPNKHYDDFQVSYALQALGG